jgi:hypothetical protein
VSYLLDAVTEAERRTMNDRITQRDLENVCTRINRTVNGDAGKITRVKSGEVWDDYPPYTPVHTDGARVHYVQTPDVYVISYAYGGASLHRNCSADGNGESHGVSDVLGSGHMPKRELYERMQAFLRGIEAAA